MNKEEILKKLEHFNDPTFIFEPIEHKYTLNGKPLISATTYVGNFIKEFDEDYWSKKKADEAGVDQSVILEKWKTKRDRACDIGSMTHDYIENFYEKNITETPDDEEVVHRIKKFHTIYENRLIKLESIASELRIFSRIWPICGTLDKLFLYEGYILVGDWKTSETVKTDDDFCFNYMLYPFNKYKENEINKFSVQVSLYQLILEEAGIYSDQGFVVHLPPGEKEPKVHKLKCFKEELRGYLNKQAQLLLTDDDIEKLNKKNARSEKLF